MFSKTKTERSTKEYSAAINVLRTALEDADAVVAGAGAGLSASAGFAYSGERSEKYFSDFEKNTAFTICIQAASASLDQWQNTGRSGAGIYT